MTNQTIDGVPRELLERITAGPNQVDYIKAWKELRALLEAPVSAASCIDSQRYLRIRAEAERDYVEFGDKWYESGSDLDAAVDALEPAAQPHDEAQRVIDRLESSDPDFNDCADAVCLIRALSDKQAIVELDSDARQAEYNQLHEIISGPGDCHSAARRVYAAGYRKYEKPAPVAVALPERSPKDYAIEHAEYMAMSADDVLAKFQAYGLALLAVDEGGDDGEGELFENIDSARGDLQESLVDLRGMVYEFRKRAAKSR